MPTKRQKDDFCRLYPCLGPVMACVKDAKSPFPRMMAYMCVWAGTQPAHAVSHPGQLKNLSLRNLFIVTTHNDLTIQAM